MGFELYKGYGYRLVQKACNATDGDCVKVQVAAEWEPHWRHIRLHGIDAPEIEQPYGEAAKQVLQDLVNKSPKLFIYITDYPNRRHRHRHIAILHRGKRSDSLNADMVRMGFAYAFRQYSHDYEREELIAQQNRAGVWQQPSGGIRPWIHRHYHHDKYPRH